ncbi:MarR family transcriptional regulator [uncultured Methanobrevibacter sp.]|uniref:MarR family transcriptional regulator n=1 Tax=uncultured Methanobrevibacter sp. TaxID=253161 RepID=UPI0025FAECA2|nr:MarR family transcriptional regulator [uncultured Methanobrevibacter sp.]
MADLNFDDELINFTPLIMYIDYIHLLQDDYYKKNLKNITPRDVTYLMNIFYHQNCSQKDLSELLFVSEANVAQIIKRLEKNEFIKRTPDTENKSRKIINLTEKGKLTIFSLLKEMYEWEGEFFKDYPLEDVEKLKRMLYDYSQKAIDYI